jgi:hypothetical protein
MQFADGVGQRDLRDIPRAVGIVREPGQSEAIEAREVLFEEAIESLLVGREQLPG